MKYIDWKTHIFAKDNGTCKISYRHMFWNKKTYITITQKIGVQIDENALHEILNEVDLNKNGQVEIHEFLQVGFSPEREETTVFVCLCKYVRVCHNYPT